MFYIHSEVDASEFEENTEEMFTCHLLASGIWVNDYIDIIISIHS